MIIFFKFKFMERWNLIDLGLKLKSEGSLTSEKLHGQFFAELGLKNPQTDIYFM